MQIAELRTYQLVLTTGLRIAVPGNVLLPFSVRQVTAHRVNWLLRRNSSFAVAGPEKRRSSPESESIELPQALIDWLEGRKVEEVECIVSDIVGIGRGKAMPAR